MSFIINYGDFNNDIYIVKFAQLMYVSLNSVC